MDCEEDVLGIGLRASGFGEFGVQGSGLQLLPPHFDRIQQFLQFLKQLAVVRRKDRNVITRQ
jgi:hypothetical protein